MLHIQQRSGGTLACGAKYVFDSRRASGNCIRQPRHYAIKYGPVSPSESYDCNLMDLILIDCVFYMRRVLCETITELP